MKVILGILSTCFLFIYSSPSLINQRITYTSASIIDHIWTNDSKKYQTSGIRYTSISDHFPIFSIFTTTSDYVDTRVTISRRIFNDNFIDSLKTDLQNYEWNLDCVTGINESFNLYISRFHKIYDKHFPLKQFTIKEKQVGKPYISTAIKK